jgi:3-deoxy-D-manno-octulosonate 8-phosphate phosphatase (KDO 8-P phosphatase)
MVDVTLTQRIARVELLVLDVDGVLTDGRIVYCDDGRETKAFHVRDGSAIRFWIEAGKQAAIISGRNSAVVVKRARELGITRIVQGAGSKLAALQGLLDEMKLTFGQVCVIGDDLPDWPMIRHCGFSVAVADACPELRAAAHWVTRAPGGAGAVREVIERLMRGQGLWQPLLARFQSETL